MLIIPQKVKMKWHNINKNYYANRGYVFTKLKDEFEVDVQDLPKGSHVKVEVACDGCGKRYFKEYKAHVVANRRDFCLKCRMNVRAKETCLVKYGTEYATQNDKVKEKFKNTCIKKWGVENPRQVLEIKKRSRQTCVKKYGTEHPMQSETVKNKVKQTCIEKYGVDHCWKSEQVRNTQKQTCLEKYGFEYPAQSEVVKQKVKKTFLKRYGTKNPFCCNQFREKFKQTCLKRYGVEHPSQLKENRDKAKKTMISRYGHPFMAGKNGIIVPASKQQKCIQKIVGGDLNYRVGKFFLDIALVEEKIDIEYDGTGHRLSVKLKGISEKEYDDLEQARENKLFKKGWKIIRLVNKTTDILPSEKEIKNIIKDCVDRLKTTAEKKIIIRWS